MSAPYTPPPVRRSLFRSTAFWTIQLAVALAVSALGIALTWVADALYR